MQKLSTKYAPFDFLYSEFLKGIHFYEHASKTP